MRRGIFVFLLLGCVCQAMEFSPMVRQLGGHRYEISRELKSILPDLYLHILRSYRTTKRDVEDAFIHFEAIFNSMELKAGSREFFPGVEIGYNAPYAFEHDWYCDKNFSGTHGVSVISSLTGSSPEDDFPGYVALKRGDSKSPDILLIVMRGSQGESFQSARGYLGPDWQTNFSIYKKTGGEKIFGFKGKFHHGFLEKELSYRENLMGSIHKVLVNELKGKTDNLLIVVTGHSQGGALAIITYLDLLKNFAPIVYGRNYNNAKENRLYLLALSPPQTLGDDSTVRSAHTRAGKHNMVRLNVIHDIVPNAGLSKIKKGVLKYYDVGFLALQESWDVAEKALKEEVYFRNRSSVEAKGELLKMQQIFAPICMDLKLSYKYHLASRRHDKWSPAYWTNKIAAGTMFADALGGIKELGAYTEYGFKFWVSAWHYGDRANPGGGAAFDPRLPTRNLEDALARGYTHEHP